MSTFRLPATARLLLGAATFAASLLPAGAASAVRAPYPGAGTSPALERAIDLTWPAGLRAQALNVAWCESRGVPTARNGQYKGHFQIGRAEWNRFGSGDPFDPVSNSAAAYRYYAYAGSWRPWQCKP